MGEAEKPRGGKDDDLAGSTCYELLGIEHDATDKDIQGAYRKMSKTCHPDKCPDDPEAAMKFDRLTRAKDLLLNPIKRSEIDHERKAREELQHRFAQEDGKRRKMREDLEGREDAAARDEGLNAARMAPRECVEAAKKRRVQADFAERIKARTAEKTQQQAGVVAMAEATLHSRAEVEVGYVRVSWRDDSKVTEKAIREVLLKFDLKSLQMKESSATAMLASKEDALRAVLDCRQRKHTLCFRVTLDTSNRGSDDGQTSTEQNTGAAPAPDKPKKKAATAKPLKPGVAFGDWEKDMLGDLMNLAKAQKRKKPAPATGDAAS